MNFFQLIALISQRMESLWTTITITIIVVNTNIFALHKQEPIALVQISQVNLNGISMGLDQRNVNFTKALIKIF